MDDYINETMNYGKLYFPRHPELAIKFQVNLKTIKSYIKRLVKLGLLIETPNPGYANYVEMVDFRKANVLDGTNIKGLVAEHKNQRKLERAEQQEVWQRLNNPVDEADFDDEPVVSLNGQVVETPPKPPEAIKSPLPEPTHTEPEKTPPEAVQEEDIEKAISKMAVVLGYGWPLDMVIEHAKAHGKDEAINLMMLRMESEANESAKQAKSKWSR